MLAPGDSTTIQIFGNYLVENLQLQLNTPQYFDTSYLSSDQLVAPSSEATAYLQLDSDTPNGTYYIEIKVGDKLYSISVTVTDNLQLMYMPAVMK